MKNIDYDISIDAVHALLLDFNVPSHLIGFNLLADAIVIKINDPCAAVQDIYSAIAVKHDKSVGAVTRDINYAIKQTDDLYKSIRLSEQQVFGSRVISNLAIYIKARLCPPPPFVISLSSFSSFRLGPFSTVSYYAIRFVI